MTAATDHATLASARWYDSDESTMEWDALAPRVSVSANSVALDAIGHARPGIVAGRYHVNTLLGTGGMGTVWLAPRRGVAACRRAEAIQQRATR